MRRVAQFSQVILLALYLSLAGCGATRIGDISADVERFQDQSVTIEGEVAETLALPFVHKGVYQLEDGSGSIWVVPSEAVPERGSRVRVTGAVRSGFEIAGKRFGLVIMESSRE